MKSQLFVCTMTSFLAISASAFADYNHPHSVGGLQLGASLTVSGFTTGSWVTSKGAVSEEFYSGNYYKTLATSEETVTAKVFNKNFPIAYMGTYGEGLVYWPDKSGASSYTQIGTSLTVMNNVVWNPGAMSSWGSPASVTTQSSTSQSADTNYWGSQFYNTTIFDSGWVPIYSIFIFEIDVNASAGGSVTYSPSAKATARTNCAGTSSTQGGVSCYNWAHTTTAYSKNSASAQLTGSAQGRVGINVLVAGAHAGGGFVIDLLKATSTQTTNASNVNATSAYQGGHTWSWSGKAVDTLSSLSGSFVIHADISTIAGNLYNKDWTAFSWSGLTFPVGNASMSGSEAP